MTQEPGIFRDPAARPHWVVLGFCLGLLLLALVMRTPRPGGEHITLAGFTLPPMCAMKRHFGVDCPGCGLTRSFVATVHGRLGEAWDWHRLGSLSVLYVLAQLVRHGLWLMRPDSRAWVDRRGRWLDLSLIGFGLLLLVNWLVSSGAQHLF